MLAGQSDVRAKPRTHFDEVIRRYTNPPSQKKKAKQVEQLQENVELQTLRKNLTKDIEEDETIINNTYDPVQGSPRYTKNRRRENEVFNKANISNVGEEMPTAVSGRKKSKRALPPPPVQNADESDKNALRSEIKLSVEADLGQKKKGKKGKSRSGDDAVVTKAEAEREDNLLQEYQQQITQEEQRALKKTRQKKESETLQEVIVLNNEFEKKKKKKTLKERKEEESELPSKHHQNQMKLAADEAKSKEDVQSDILEEKEETVKPIGKKKKKRKPEVIVADSQTEVDASPSQAFDDSLVLGVYIHRTDRLKMDLLVSHPMVKVHVVDEITGQYVKKEDSHRRVSSFYEQENIEHVLPIITQPFDFKKQKSTVPEWEEQIIFNERFSYFLQQIDEAPKVILFFEILEFMSMEEAKANASADLSERGFRKIAWAFLKLVGTNGVLNVDNKLRLQLYSPPPRARKNPQTLEVFQWWSKYPWNRYSSTLYVTVKGLKLPEHVDPSIRSMMALQQERGSTSYAELHTELTQKTFTQLLESKSDAVIWSRLPGQVCRIPNKPMLSFRGGQMGCFALRFSHDGRVLAAACADRDAFPILVYEIPSGRVLVSFNGHLSIVYDLCWTRDDTCLLSASSDGTVRVWNIERLQGLAQKILPHPSFVYSAQYHPLAPSLVVTGGYDGLLRVWNLDVKDVNGQLLQEFEGHKTFINALCFDNEGSRMFSADNAGLIIAWSAKVKDGSWHGAAHLWRIEKEIKESDLNGIPISSLEVHPNGRRLLIHAKDSVLRVMDLRIFAIKKYIGATNYKERINSTFTPCGNFIFSGSEDGLAYVWNAETGDQVAVYSELCYTTALRGVAFHPHEHLVAFCAFGQNQPIQLYVYDRKVTQMELESMRLLNRSDTVASKTASNHAEIPAFQDVSASGMDRFASAARMSLKMQRVKQKLDLVLEPHHNTSAMEYRYEQGIMPQLGRGLSQEGSGFQGLHTSLPAPSLLSPHSNLQLSSSLGAQLIPQATLSSQTFCSTAFAHPIRRKPSLKQGSLQDSEFPLSVETDLEQVQQRVVTLYDYNANRSDELTLRRGDVIYVLHKDNENWWFGRLASGHRGYFPAAYVADEKGFDKELSQATDTQPGPSEQINEGVKRASKLSAAVSDAGELKIISEQDTDAEATSVRTKRKKKKVKKSELSYDLPPTTSADVSQPSTRKYRPLPRLEQTHSAFKSNAANQEQGLDWGDN